MILEPKHKNFEDQYKLKSELKKYISGATGLF